MKYPKLVRAAKTPVHVTITTEEPNEFNEREVLAELDLLCNFQASSKLVYTNEKQSVTLSGTAFFDGDILPGVGFLSSGTVTVFGEERTIFRGTKARNPDGTVNYTKLELI